ncbi:oryzin [Cladochytrium replicatum]|nr:oryzin [Cladochytrium replicatum]
MRTTCYLFALAAVVAVCDAGKFIPNTHKRSLNRRDASADSKTYIVVYATDADKEAHQAWLQNKFVSSEYEEASTAVTKSYDFLTWNAYALTAPEELALEVADRDNIDTVMESVDYKVTDVENNAVPGLARTSSANRGGTTYSFPSSAGQGVDAYVIDTGIKTTHTEFEGRATLGKSFVNNGQGGDGNGHGTHVAGTIGSKTFGIAKKANLIAVRVLDASGAGSSDTVLSGIEFAISAAKASGRPSVINMSLGGQGDDPVTTRALDTAKANGIVAVVAAGNEGQDACNTSPANVASAITVAAIDPRTDQMPAFSNFGTCVDIAGPGVDIQSTWIGNGATPGDNGLTNIISGTSMSTPHVAGVAALIYAENPNGGADNVISTLLNIATAGKIRNVKRNTPNKILFNNGAAGFGSDANNGTTPGDGAGTATDAATDAATETAPATATTTVDGATSTAAEDAATTTEAATTTTRKTRRRGRKNKNKSNKAKGKAKKAKSSQ